MRKSDARARRARERWSALMLVVDARRRACSALARVGGLTTRLLRPLSVLGAAVRRLGEGDLSARARRRRAATRLPQLAASSTPWPTRLQQYRDSSLGELLQAQQASQAAIDSLPDPVLVLDAGGRAAQREPGGRGAARRRRRRRRRPARRRRARRCARWSSGCASTCSPAGAPYVPEGLEEAIASTRADGERTSCSARQPGLRRGGRGRRRRPSCSRT